MSWQELENETTEDLIEYIRSKNDPAYVELAKKAATAFMFRFQKDVLQKCREICPHFGYSKEDGDVIAEKVFEKFLKYPNGFNKTKCTKGDVNLCIKLYLYRIASRVLIDKKNQDNGIGVSPYSGNEEIVKEINIENLDLPANTKKDLRKKKELIESALASLSPKHKIIFLTYQMHQKEGHQMPRTLLKSLRNELDLTQNSIQVYKKEAYDAFNKHIEIYGNK